MKKLVLTLVLSIISSILLAFTNMKRMPLEQPLDIEPFRPLALVVSPPKVKIKVVEVKNHNKFLDDIGFKESSNNYKAINQFGYLGKYQFSRSTLNSLGYNKVSNKEFLSTPKIQERAMEDLLKHNKKVLNKFIEKYEGKTINGVLITESGVLAAAHLGGAGNIRKFFRKGSNFRDGNGTSIVSYMKKFSGYNLDL